ncbi:hypothetical protein BOX15_Mlig030907g1, partial [Macrostomum lignano]
ASVGVYHYSRRLQPLRCEFCGGVGRFSDIVSLSRLTVADYEALLNRGWRRSASRVYRLRPDLTCCAKFPMRHLVDAFRPSRSQRRCLRRFAGALFGSAPVGPAGDSDLPTGRGANYQTGSETNYQTGSETNYQTGSETNYQTGSETNYQTGSETNYQTGSETNYQTGSETNYQTGSETNYQTGSETNYQTGSETNYQTGSETNYQTGSETNYQTGSETNYQTGSETNYQTGSETNYQTGSETNYQTGSETNYQTGSETNYQTGSETNYQTGSGTNYQTGSENILHFISSRMRPGKARYKRWSAGLDALRARAGALGQSADALLAERANRWRRRRELRQRRQSAPSLAELVDPLMIGGPGGRGRLLWRLVPSDSQLAISSGHACYSAYQCAVHGDSPADCGEAKFRRFLCLSPLAAEAAEAETDVQWPKGSHHSQLLLDGRLIGVDVIDILDSTVSSAYFFFDPAFKRLQLGKVSALLQLRRLQGHPRLRHYTMGSYSPLSVKLAYKAEFQPAQIMCPIALRWLPFDRDYRCRLEAGQLRGLYADLGGADDDAEVGDSSDSDGVRRAGLRRFARLAGQQCASRFRLLVD